MGKLLRADLFRAFRFKIFYVLAAVNAVFGIISVFNQLSWRGLDAGVSAFDVMQDGFGSGVGFIGILNAVLVAIFIGHEYACGAMRNKVMTGGGRQKIYLSELIVSCTMCAAVYLIFHLVNFALGSALLGWGDHSFAEIILALLAGLFMSLAYCAVFTGVAMLSKNTVTGLLAGVLGTLVMLFVVMWLAGELQGSYVQDPNDPQGAIPVPCRWPEWVQALVRGFIRLIPTGQSVLLTAGLAQSLGAYGTLIGLSCVWLALSAIGGSLLFRKTDMK